MQLVKYIYVNFNETSITSDQGKKERKKKKRIGKRGRLTIVFKPGPVQGPGSGFWPGHRVLTGSAGWIPILKKIQNGIVLVKNKYKSQRVSFLIIMFAKLHLF